MNKLIVKILWHILHILRIILSHMDSGEQHRRLTIAEQELVQLSDLTNGLARAESVERDTAVACILICEEMRDSVGAQKAADTIAAEFLPPGE